MVSGGARARSGPPPDPNALRRDRKSDRAEWVMLPASGRVGDAPAWPLSRALKRELELWERLWRMPQAVEWERQELELTVGMYVRRLVVAERRTAKAGDVTAVRQLADGLGLTTPGLRSNRWRIEPAAAEVEAEPAKVLSARDRFRVVADDEVEGAAVPG